MGTRHIPKASIVARWNTSDQAVDLVIDGRALIDIVDPQKQWGVSPFARRFSRRAARGWVAEYRGVSGDRNERLLGGELEIAVCGACGDLGCGNLAVYLDMDADTAQWRQPHWAGDDEEDDDEPDANDPRSLMPQILVFDRAQYEAALADTERFINRPGWRRETPEAALWLDRLRNRFTRLWEVASPAGVLLAWIAHAILTLRGNRKAWVTRWILLGGLPLAAGRATSANPRSMIAARVIFRLPGADSPRQTFQCLRSLPPTADRRVQEPGGQRCASPG